MTEWPLLLAGALAIAALCFAMRWPAAAKRTMLPVVVAVIVAIGLGILTARVNEQLSYGLVFSGFALLFVLSGASGAVMFRSPFASVFFSLLASVVMIPAAGIGLLFIGCAFWGDCI